MDIEDRLAIEDLYARYCVTLDTGDEAGWVACFSPHGVFSGRSPARGRAELVGYHRDRMAARAEEPFTNPQHWNANLQLSGEPPEVAGFSYVMRIGTMRADGSIRIVRLAAYRDRLVKQDGRWLFARRDVSFEPVPHAEIFKEPGEK